MPWEGVHALVERARTGDRNAWTDLHALVAPFLLGLAQKLLGPGWPERTAHDLTQDTWLKFCENIGEFRGGGNDEQTGAVLRAWFGQAMTRSFKNDLRYRNAAMRSQPGGQVTPLAAGSAGGSTTNSRDPPAPDPSPSVAVRQAEQRARIELALAQLDDPHDQAIVSRYFYQSESLRQIAENIGLTYDQVRYRFGKALARLGDDLKEPL